MSKIIYLTPPAHGHVNPTLPIMQELVRRGEQVVCYNTEDFRSKIEQTGAIFRAYADSEMTSVEITRLLQDGNLANITGLILRTTEQLLPFLIAELSHEKPDLVVFDAIALWGKMASTHLNLKAAASIGLFVMDQHHMKSLDLLRMIKLVLPTVPGIVSARRRLMKHFEKAFPTNGPLFPMRDGLNLVYTARALQPDTPLIDETFRFVGPSINPDQQGDDFPLDLQGTGPVVYISLGTIHTAHTAFYKTCFEAFADYQARFILSVGRQTNIDGLGSIPLNFKVYPFVPQLKVLQHTDVFISHGGMNSIHEGLYYGIPLVLIPQQFEQLLNARCVASRGAGYILDEHLKHRAVPPARLWRALDLVLSESGYRTAAKQIQQSLQATGGYKEAADEIQAYLAR
jgi:hypothetical protein